MENIIKIAYLVEYLNRTDVLKRDKATQVKLAVQDGIITQNDGIELIIEYTTP